MALMRDYASDKQVSPPSVVYWGIHLCKTSLFYILKMRLGSDLKFTRLT